MCMLPQSYWPACLGRGFVIDEYMERVLDTMEVTALVEAVCSSSSLWGLGVFGALPTNQSVPVVRHSALVTPHLSLCRSWCHSFSCPGRKLGGFPLADVFHGGSLGSSDPSVYLCTDHHPLPRVCLLSQKLDSCVLSGALGYISKELLNVCSSHYTKVCKARGLLATREPSPELREKGVCAVDAEKFCYWTKGSGTHKSLQNRFTERS